MESRNISVEVHLNGTQKAKRSYSFLDQQEQYNREFRNTVKVEKNEENSSSSMIEETSEIQSEVQKEISPDYKGKKKAFVQSENETIPKPAKTPITAEIIIEENPPMASVYHNRYVHYQCDVDNLIKNGSNPSDIVYDNEGFIDINYIKSVKEDKNNEEINNINNVNDVELDALTEQTVHYLRKAWKISEEDIPSLKRDVKNVYIRRGEQALVTQKYYELQRDKKREWSAMKKFCSNIYYTLSIPTKHENRRNKKAITLLYGKEKERLAHLVDKYGNKANQHNKRGKEQTILREIIKHKEIYAGQITSFKREQAKVVLSYLRITHEMEKVFRDAICMIPKHQDPTMAKQRMKAAKFSYETFLQRFTISSLEEVKYLSAETQAVTLNEIKKTKSELEATIKRLMKPFDADLSLNNIENVVGVSMGVTGVVLSAVAG